jgi:hypothetical protein
MVKLFYFFYLNRNDLSFSFIVLSFYRSFKRIQKRLKTFDTQDKVFFFFFSSAILIGLTGFYYLENPGLKIVELYFIMPVFCSYLYIITKKIFNNKYFPIFWLVLIACYPLTTVIVGIQAYCCDGIFILEEFNTFEISFITKELLNFFNGVFNLSDHNKYTECQPEKSNNIFNRELPEISPFLRRKYTEAFLDSVNHAGVAGGFAHIVKNNPRITVATGITVGLFSFINKVV